MSLRTSARVLVPIQKAILDLRIDFMEPLLCPIGLLPVCFNLGLKLGNAILSSPKLVGKPLRRIDRMSAVLLGNVPAGSKSRRVSTSLSKTKRSMPCRSKAPGPSKSINSFLAAGLTTVISTPHFRSRRQGWQDAFAVIRDTIAKMGMVAVGQVVLTRREHIIALEARGRGLVGLTLRYPYEVRDDKPYFEDIPELKTPKEMLDLATHIVQTKSGHFDPAQFDDRYENALIDLLKKKEAGEKIEPAKEGPAPQVVNLMDALRASIDAGKKKAPAPSTQARRPAKKRASQK